MTIANIKLYCRPSKMDRVTKKVKLIKNNNLPKIKFFTKANVNHWRYTDVMKPKLWTKLINLCKDNNYRVTADRGLSLYKKLFFTPNKSTSKSSLVSLDTHLKNLISQKSELKALDCGAGRGIALKNLLIEYKNFTRATGISIHPFLSAAENIKIFGGRLEYFFDKAQNVLPLLPSNEYNLIMDVWGAYFYSLERIEIIKQYWRLLTPGGCAFVILGESVNDNDVVQYNQDDQKKMDSLPKYLVRTWPKIFNYQKDDGGHGHRWLVISKNKIDDPTPNLDFKLVSSSSKTFASVRKCKTVSYPDHLVFRKMSKIIY